MGGVAAVDGRGCGRSQVVDPVSGQLERQGAVAASIVRRAAEHGRVSLRLGALLSEPAGQAASGFWTLPVSQESSNFRELLAVFYLCVLCKSI